MVFTGLIVVGAGLYWLPWAPGSPAERAGHGEGGPHVHTDREPREVDPPYPTLSVEVVPEDGRRVLRLRTERFRFVAPGETAPSTVHAGHGHLEIDDESIAMFYEPRYVLPRFQPGTYALRVTLNGTDHAPLAVDGRVVADTVTLEVTRTRPAPAEAR